VTLTIAIDRVVFVVTKVVAY